MNDTEALEERVVFLEAEMDIVQSTLVILQDEVNEVQDDVDLLETEDSLFDQRLILLEAEIATNENAIDGDILSFEAFYAIDQRFSKLNWDVSESQFLNYHIVKRLWHIVQATTQLDFFFCNVFQIWMRGWTHLIWWLRVIRRPFQIWSKDWANLKLVNYYDAIVTLCSSFIPSPSKVFYYTFICIL